MPSAIGLQQQSVRTKDSVSGSTFSGYDETIGNSNPRSYRTEIVDLVSVPDHSMGAVISVSSNPKNPLPVDSTRKVPCVANSESVGVRGKAVLDRRPLDTSPNSSDVGMDHKDLDRGESFGANLSCAGAHDLLPVSVRGKAVLDRRPLDDSQNRLKSSRHIHKNAITPSSKASSHQNHHSTCEAVGTADLESPHANTTCTESHHGTIADDQEEFEFADTHFQSTKSKRKHQSQTLPSKKKRTNVNLKTPTGFMNNNNSKSNENGTSEPKFSEQALFLKLICKRHQFVTKSKNPVFPISMAKELFKAYKGKDKKAKIDKFKTIKWYGNEGVSIHVCNLKPIETSKSSSSSTNVT